MEGSEKQQEVKENYLDYKGSDNWPEDQFVESIGSAVKPQPKSLDQELLERAEYYSYINDPEERKNAVSLALQIEKFVGKNWFNFERFIKKSKESPESGRGKLEMAILFGVVARKPDNRRGWLYKTVVTNQDRIDALEEIIDFHREAIKQLEIQKIQLQP